MSIRKVKNHSEKNTKLKIQKAGSRDRQPVMSILKRTGFFRDCELKTAQEVFVQSLLNPRKNGYYSIVAKNGTKTIGWICYGPTPCTLGTFDIYWIAVEPQFQRDGIGTALTG
ncbi:MAG: GNAT family N-acetyltransferase, partial [Sedimentisphaerales bacterium]|nr:GNAT family N-acetyltransferase [Sedimentisphaerales bacterium]